MSQNQGRIRRLKTKLSVNILTPIEIVTSYPDYEEETRFADTLADELSDAISNSSSAIEEWAVFDEYDSLKNVKCECSELFLDSIEKDLSSITLIAKISIESDKEIEDLRSIVSSNLERFCVDSLDGVSYTYSYVEFDEYDVLVKFKESTVTVNED